MTKTQLAILWGLGVLVVAILGGLGWMLSRSEQTQALSPMSPAAELTVPARISSEAVYLLPETPYSARNQYRLAAQAAQDWQPDAGLVSAAASWPFANLDDFSRQIDWTYQFYSPVTGRVYTINVDQASVTPIREALSPYALPIVDVEQWQVDSYQAINAWLDRGGGVFLKQHPVVDVSIRLAQSQDDTPAWTVVGMDDSGEAVQAERVDAQ